MSDIIYLDSEQDSIHCAIKVAAKLKFGDIVTFSGELGAGKTFLAARMINYLLGGNIKVKSPTFPILQIYPMGEVAIYHYDLYRLKNPEEIYELAIEDAWNGQNICLIEWPEIIAHLLPLKRIAIQITFENQRRQCLIT